MAHKATNPSVPASLYRSHLVRARAGKNWFQFFRPYFLIMKRLDALFLQDVLNLAGLDGSVVDEKDYFLCTGKYLRNSTAGWTTKEQTTHFKSLRAKGYIQIELRGNPASRWVWINLEKIELDLDKVQVQFRPKGTNWIRPNGRLKKKPLSEVSKKGKKKAATAATPPASVSTPTPKEDMFFDQYASKQRNPPDKVHIAFANRMLSVFKKYKVYPGQFAETKWAREIRDISETIGVDRTEKVIAYLETREENANPQIRSVAEMARHVNWLEDNLAKTVTVSDTGSDPRVQTLVQKLQEYYPRQSHKNLLVTVSKSAETVTDIKAKLPEMIREQEPKIYVPHPKDPKKKCTLASEVRYLNDILIYVQKGLSLRLLDDWFLFVFNEKLKGWKGWSGNMSAYVFKPGTDLFASFWPYWMNCETYCDRFVKEYTAHAG